MDDNQNKKTPDNPEVQNDSPIENVNLENSQPPPETQTQTTSDSSNIPPAPVVKKSRKLLLLGSVLFIIALIVGGIFYFSRQKGLIKTTPSNEVSPTSTTSIDETFPWCPSFLW